MLKSQEMNLKEITDCAEGYESLEEFAEAFNQDIPGCLDASPEWKDLITALIPLIRVRRLSVNNIVDGLMDDIRIMQMIEHGEVQDL